MPNKLSSSAYLNITEMPMPAVFIIFTCLTPYWFTGSYISLFSEKERCTLKIFFLTENAASSENVRMPHTRYLTADRSQRYACGRKTDKNRKMKHFSDEAGLLSLRC